MHSVSFQNLLYTLQLLILRTGSISLAADVLLIVATILLLTTWRVPPIVLVVLMIISIGAKELRAPSLPGGAWTASGTLGLLFAIGLPLVMMLVWRVPSRLERFPSGISVGDPGDHPRCAEWVAQLVGMGFTYVGDLHSGALLEGKAFRFFRDPSGTVIARVTLHRMRFTAVSFVSEQAGRRVSTSNWPSIQTWPPPSGDVIFYHQLCRDVGELLERHRRHLEDRTMDRPEVFEPSGVLARMESFYAETLSSGLERGYLARSSQARCRMTLKGSMRGCFIAMFYPMKRRFVQVGS